MSTRPGIRRAIVSGGVVLALFLAAVTVRSAALWTSSSAPLSVAPVAVDSIEKALADERMRSAALEQQITELDAAAADLGVALEAARTRLGTDQATATELRASLTAAQKKLVKLEAALRAAASRRAAPATVTVAGGSGMATSRQPQEPGDGVEVEHDDE